MANIIFVGGLDDRRTPPPSKPDAKTEKELKEAWKGGGGALVDKTISEQTDIVKGTFRGCAGGYGPTADIISFRYSDSDKQVKDAIAKNKTAQVLLFSAGCGKTLVLAQYMKSLEIPLENLFVNEPYTPKNSSNLKNIEAAIGLGLPASNCFCGTTSDLNGANIVGHTDTSSLSFDITQPDGKIKKLKRVDHFFSCALVGKIMFDKLQTTPSQKPTIDFSFSVSKIKTGGTVSIVNNTKDATSYLWKSVPETSVVIKTATSSTPILQFNTAGTYSIVLEAKNAGATASKESAEKIVVEDPKKDPPPKLDDPKKDPPKEQKIIDPPTTVSKITLKKKSGPGELKGVVEKEVKDGKVSFTGLQFDQAGTYVIEAIPSNPDLEKTEFTIVVDPEPNNIEQTKKEEEKTEIKGDRPIIAQIDEPNQKLQPITRPITTVDETLQSASSFGIVPVLFYNGAEVARETGISQLTLYIEDNMPKCKVKFTDANGIVVGNEPRDDTKFEVFLNSTDADIKSIHIAFKIKKHNKEEGGKQIYYFEGVISVDDLFVQNSETYKGTSFKVLKKIAKRLDLGFNSNITDTDDEMKWINTNKEMKDFIKEVVDHAYKDDKTFLYQYIDFYYCLNYVDIEKEWNRENGSDVFVETGGLAKDGKGKGKDKLIPGFLTNEPANKNSCGYFESFKIMNRSTETSLQTGYRTVVRFYDEDKKSILEFEIDSQSSEGNKNIILKGEEGTNKFADKKVSKKFLGRVDNDNVHKNYNYAKEQNRINLDNLTKITCSIILPNINYNLYRFQKVRMLFYNLNGSVTRPEELDFRYTGDWIIIDIVFDWVTTKNGTKFVQKLVVARKELGKSPKEQQEEKEKPKENKEGNKNENPTAQAQVKPNSKYQVGQKVQLVKADGTKYEVEITKISENGIEVEGKLKNI